MKGKLYIDGDDIYVKFGVFVEYDGYKSLVQFPALKKVESNDWAEHDGIDVDLSNPTLNTRNITINFIGLDNALVFDFLALLADGAEHDFLFVDIGKTLRLRLVSQPNKNLFCGAEWFSLQFADDDPFADYNTYVAPTSSYVSQKGYVIDGIDLSQYGVFVMPGSDDSILKSPDVKNRLTVNHSYKNGATYGGKTLQFRPTPEIEMVVPRKIDLFFKSKDITLKCLIRADGLSQFWQNYNALFWDLKQPQERDFVIRHKLPIGYTDISCLCYYKSSSVSKFEVFQSGEVWCEFSITLTFMKFRVNGIDTLLSSENEILIITEDNINLIDLKYEYTKNKN